MMEEHSESYEPTHSKPSRTAMASHANLDLLWQTNNGTLNKKFLIIKFQHPTFRSPIPYFKAQRLTFLPRGKFILVTADQYVGRISGEVCDTVLLYCDKYCCIVILSFIVYCIVTPSSQITLPSLKIHCLRSAFSRQTHC